MPLPSLFYAQCTGCDSSHLSDFAGRGDCHQLGAATLAAFRQLQDAAQSDGFELAVASAHRGFQRQLAIWNSKAAGQRPVLDSAGAPLDIAQLSERQRVFAILRWSALPGASRHHWGTDLDVYDAAALPAGQVLQLDASECVAGGVFADFHQWLGQRIAGGEAYGFYRPYSEDRGGVAPEPWHISFAPEASQFEQQMDPVQLREFIAAQDIALREIVLDEFDEIYQRFIVV